ncbi:hypothetical protein V492_08138, partial [Pseudogymnoascus sp. VKM F-4246]
PRLVFSSRPDGWWSRRYVIDVMNEQGKQTACSRQKGNLTSPHPRTANEAQRSASHTKRNVSVALRSAALEGPCLHHPHRHVMSQPNGFGRAAYTAYAGIPAAGGGVCSGRPKAG